MALSDRNMMNRLTISFKPVEFRDEKLSRRNQRNIGTADGFTVSAVRSWQAAPPSFRRLTFCQPWSVDAGSSHGDPLIKPQVTAVHGGEEPGVPDAGVNRSLGFCCSATRRFCHFALATRVSNNVKLANGVFVIPSCLVVSSHLTFHQKNEEVPFPKKYLWHPLKALWHSKTSWI